MKIMLLGSKGLVGTAVEWCCKDKGLECVGYSHQELDITEEVLLIDEIKKIEPDIVINTTGIVGINPCEFYPDKAFLVNSVAPYRLAKICHKELIPIVHVSTHNVFDGSKFGWYTENDIPNPIQVYGVSKYAGELLIQRFKKHYIFRFPTLFGDRRNDNIGFPNRIINRLKKGEEVKVAMDKIDSPSYSIDVASQLLDVITTKMQYGVYHCANFGSPTYLEFFLEVARILDADHKKIIPVVEKEFNVMAPNALWTAMKSDKIDMLRPWTDALEEYLRRE